MSEGVERVQFSGKVDEKGHCHPDKVRETAYRLAKWAGRRVTVTVQRYVKSKTNAQLALYFGPVIEAWSEHTGYTPGEMDDELRLAFLAPELAVARLTGEETTERPRIRDLSSEQMSTYLERVMREGRLLGIEFQLDRIGG